MFLALLLQVLKKGVLYLPSSKSEWHTQSVLFGQFLFYLLPF